MSGRRNLAIAVATALTMTGAAVAQDLPETKLSIIGSFGTLNGFKLVEQPFWTTHIPEASGGKVTADITPLDQLNLQGPEVLRLLRLGTADIVSSASGYVSSDVPALEGADLPGIFPNLATMRDALASYRPEMERLFEANFNSKLLGVWPTPPNVLFCREPVNSLADLKGRKIRSWSAGLNTIFEGVGATPVQVSFAETVPALERGTVDCAPTGVLSGNNARWWEVAKHLYPMGLGASFWVNAVNLDRWNAMSPELQAFILAEVAKLEADLWAVTEKEAAEGRACNTGEGECTLGVPGDMTYTDVTEEDRLALLEVVEKTVVAEWADRCGEECAQVWNDTIGAKLGIVAKP